MAASVDKVIVTNISALRQKHGRKGLKRIESALRKVIAADRKRGIRTKRIGLDRAADMKLFGKRVTTATSARQVKRAIDAITGTIAPAYIMILGAPDVVPHVRFPNPAAGSDDPDTHVASDLPYACDAPYGLDIRKFLGPSRVLGRLPDTQGSGDTDAFVQRIESASRWKRKPATAYGDHFSLSAESWKGATRTSIKKLFGSSKGVHLSPDEGPSWMGETLAPRVHFINCHGDIGAPEFYGEDEDDDERMPRAHLACHLDGRITTGTVVAAECCYGAELYEPIADQDTGICQAYLDAGAWGFFGSTSIAYGPADGHNWADIICVAFVRHVLAGASLGRAALLARQDYIEMGGYMESVDLKTIAQFVLLGDPSIHPVRVATSAKTKSRRRGKTAHAKAPANTKAARASRRRHMRANGTKLGRETASVATTPDARMNARVRAAIGRECRKRNVQAARTMSFCLHGPAAGVHAHQGRDMVARGTVFHVIVPRKKKQRGPSAVRPFRVLIAREVGGKIERITEALRH